MPWFEIQNKVTSSPSVPVYPFSTATDEQITDMLEAVRDGDLTVSDLGWSVGDKRSVHLSAMEGLNGDYEDQPAQDKTLVILDTANVYDLVGGGKNLFVIGIEENLDVAGAFYDQTTNGNSYTYSARRTWLDNVFKPALPAEVQKWFKTFNYVVSDGSTHTSVSTISNFFTLPSVSEVFGNENEYFDTLRPEGEKTKQLEYYKTDSNRVKTPARGQYSNNIRSFQLRSPYVMDDSSFCVASFSGGSVFVSTEYDDGDYGLSPFGCV